MKNKVYTVCGIELALVPGSINEVYRGHIWPVTLNLVVDSTSVVLDIWTNGPDPWTLNTSISNPPQKRILVGFPSPSYEISTAFQNCCKSREEAVEAVLKLASVYVNEIVKGIKHWVGRGFECSAGE